MSDLGRAYVLAKELVAILEGAVPSYAGAPAPAPAAAPAAAPAPTGAPPGGSKIPFGKYKDWTIMQVAQQGGDSGTGDVGYLGWMVENLGKDSDPKYAEKNERFKAEIRAVLQLINSGGMAAPAPSFAAEAPRPVPASAPAPESYPPPASAPLGADGFADDIPF